MLTKTRGKSVRAIGMPELSPFLSPIERKCKHTSRPGQAGKRRASSTRFGEQQNAINAMRFYYNVSGKQFRNYFLKAKKASGSTDEVFIQLLESRLDSVVFSMGFAISKRLSRQMVRHKHIMVNGKIVSCPSYAVRPGDEVSVAEAAKGHDRVVMSVDHAKDAPQKNWVECEYDKLSGVYKHHPSVDEVKLFDSHMLGMVIVYYSK